MRMETQWRDGTLEGERRKDGDETLERILEIDRWRYLGDRWNRQG